MIKRVSVFLAVLCLISSTFVPGQEVIRRPIVTGATTPSGMANIGAWYEPSREIGYSDGGFINPLTDQTGNGRNFAQSSGDAFRPVYTANFLNGLAVANFTGSRNWGG